MKQESHTWRRSASVPVRSVTSSTVVQKQVGQTIVQFPQVRQRSATSSQRGWSRLAASSSWKPLGVELSHRGRGSLDDAFAGFHVFGRRLPSGKRGEELGAALGRSLREVLAPTVLEQLRQGDVVAEGRARPGVHRDAEARLGGDAAVDGDDEDPPAPRRTPG